jgi:hypothetical protein
MLTAAANVSGSDDVMAIVPTLRFNWLPRQTLYAEAQTRTARQQALRQQQNYLSAASDILAAAATNSASGMSNLAAQGGAHAHPGCCIDTKTGVKKVNVTV